MRMLMGVLCASIGLAGCAAPAPPRVQVQRVNVPVPVVCKVHAPTRPAMPTEGLPDDVTLDAFAAAAIAEIERREGYEVRLRAALAACTAPPATSADKR